MVGLARDDLLLRGSRLWSCGKCGFSKNFSNRRRCLDCNHRPPQWIVDAQDAKVRELGKKGKGDDVDGPKGGGKQSKGASELAAATKEVKQLRAEIAALKAKSTEKPSDVQKAVPPEPVDDKDANYQRKLDDLELQLAGARALAKEASNQSFVHAFIENLEAQANVIRTERRAGWSIPRLLDRHRARVAERADRLERAAAKVEELEEEHARIAAELAEAKLHMQAKQEDLDAERAEVAKLEAQLPPPKQQPVAPPVGPTIDLEANDVEKMVLEGLRQLAARRGGLWQDVLAAMPAAAPAGGATSSGADAAKSFEQTAKDQQNSHEMEVENGQNAIVQPLSPPAVSADSGASLLAIPSMQKRVGGTKPIPGQPPKVQRRG